MTELIGRKLGSYQLQKLLGQGGFADVYLGQHVHLDTPAAVKVLRMRLTTQHTDNFRKEAQLIANFDHPHIIRVLDYGVEDEMPYLVMMYAPNGSLRQRYKQSRLPLATIVTYVKQIASALQYAHYQKLAHRDVKPENILLGRQDQALLSDFGLALITQTQHSLKPHTAGTIYYMAPEQLQGKPSTASDQYALGVVVYEWLCGEKPFKGTYFEMLGQHMAATPPPLSERFPFISPALEQVVFRALSKDPTTRFPTIQEFAQALEHVYHTEAHHALHTPTEIKPLPTPRTPPPISLKHHTPSASQPFNQSLSTPSTPLLPSPPSISSTPLPTSIPHTPYFNTPSKILSLLAIITIILSLSSYLFSFPPPLKVFTPSTSTPATLNSPSPTTTTIPSSPTSHKLLFESKNWQQWKPTNQWQALDDRTYQSDGTDDGDTNKTYIAWTPKLNLPQNYAVEATFSFERDTYNYGEYAFGIVGRANGEYTGYFAGISKDVPDTQCLDKQKPPIKAGIGVPNNGFTLLHNDTAQYKSPDGLGFHVCVESKDVTSLAQATFPFDQQPHKLRVEFVATTITLLIDGKKITTASDNRFLDPGKVGIAAIFSVVKVQDIKIYAL